MNYGMRFVTLYGDRDQDHPHGKEMQKSKMAIWGGLTNSREKKRSERIPTPVFWPGEFHGLYNGTPLQYTCLENPMDGGAWEAAVLGVARSRT